MNDFSSQMGQMARKQAEAMRSKARERARQRKEEYLGARVSKELRERVFQRAEELGMPVSLLLRQMLEEAFPPVAQHSTDRVESVVAGGGISASIIAWDEVTLGKDMSCQICQKSLGKGERVMLGIAVDSGRRPILCVDCQQKL